MKVAARRARHVEVGNMAGEEIVLSAPLIRSVSLDLRGFSVAHPPTELKRDAYLRLTEHAANGDITVDVDRVALDDVAAAWERQRRADGGAKMVLVP
jgi:NADPH:quinone reductase-like Zn-dependent oxidoreductase